MILQLTANGALSGAYSIIVLVGIVSTLMGLLVWIASSSVTSGMKALKTSIDKSNDRMDAHQKEFSALSTDHKLLKQKVESISDPEDIAEQIALKLQALRAMR